MFHLITFCFALAGIEAAKILVVIPTPSISHQFAFRPLLKEIARSGHDLTVITTDPAYEKGKAPANIREIDIHDMAYETWNIQFLPTSTTGNKKDIELQVDIAVKIMIEIFIEMLKIDEVQDMMKNETFDLLLLEAWIRPALFFTHIYKDVPAIALSSWGGYVSNYEQIGAARHPLRHPQSFAQKLTDRSMWDKVTEIYRYYKLISIYIGKEDGENRELRKFAPDMPDLRELKKNIGLMFLNVHPLWDGNRPVPPSVVYINGIHTKTKKELPKDLETYLNSSRNGVVYVSFGTNVKPSTLPPQKVQAMINVFSQLPYDVLWRWDLDNLPGKTDNIKIFKWLPQYDLLRHPSIKVFVTQCGMQSTDEAIDAGVPLVGIPMLADQWYNSEKYIQLKIGRAVEMPYLNEANLKAAIEGVIKDDSYRQNIIKLRKLMSDQPQSGTERALWWIEYMLRHGTGKHLQSPSANITWREYFELDLILVVLTVLLVLIGSVIAVLRYAVKKFLTLRLSKVKQS